MKNPSFVCFAILSVLLSSCGDEFDVSTYYEPAKRDTLLTDIITYVYTRPQYVDWRSRFDSKYRKYYVSQIPKFTFDRYYRDNRGVHYYFIIRPARSAQGTIRGVGGRFTIDESFDIVTFEEVFNTPAAPLAEVQLRGRELFMSMVKSGNIDDYLKNPDYVEWPNDLTYYDTIRHEWLVRPGL